MDAVAHFTVKTTTSAAFYTTPAEPNINQSVIDYIAASVTNNTGENFSPHVTIGIGMKAYLDAMLAEPFTAFTFSPKAKVRRPEKNGRLMFGVIRTKPSFYRFHWRSPYCPPIRPRTPETP
jgi:hypothetical protein